MAKEPSKASGSRILNIMGYLRGNIDLPDKPKTSRTQAFGKKELISQKRRSEILSDAYRATDDKQARNVSEAAILSVVKGPLTAIGHNRLENRKILSLMPNVEQAARLKIATILSPNDLTRQEIPVVFEMDDDIPEAYRKKMGDFATTFFQKKLNLRASVPSWLYQAGYEAGSSPFAIVPLRSFETIEDAAFLGVESLVNKVIEPMSCESLFGFGDVDNSKERVSREVLGLESFGVEAVEKFRESHDVKSMMPTTHPALRSLMESMIGHESLALTDNPNILQIKSEARKLSNKKINSKLNKRYKRIADETVVSVSSARNTDEDGDAGVVGNPIFMRLPPESVTVIHTPGDPADHQGYLILLDRQGNPIDAVLEQESLPNNQVNYNKVQSDIFSQVNSAYGFSSASQHHQTQEEMMGRIYNQIVSEHLRHRIDQTGMTNVEISNIDGVMRCMFARFLHRKQTRVLFLPAALVTYMAFELDQNGYGVSRLERIKFSLGMKMAVQVSRVLAAIKAAMDKRKIEVKFTDNLLENPEIIVQTIVQEYLRKNSISFSVDPNVIQSQIADKSMSIKAVDVPGMETFDITNEPDSRGAAFDFDSNLEEKIDKDIINGLGVPAAAMNSLSEDEYARSVTTTNLFFSMQVSIDQDTVVKHVSDLLRKYAKYSEEFINELLEIFPSLSKKKSSDITSIDSNQEDTGVSEEEDGFVLPDHITLDQIIDSMSISLPHPNVAPSKAQFENLSGMVASITETVTSMFPDDLMGKDDTMAAVIRLLRARFISTNIRAYLDSSGMSSIDVPESNFSAYLKDTGQLVEGLQNFAAMLDDKHKIRGPKDDMATDGFGATPTAPMQGY